MQDNTFTKNLIAWYRKNARDLPWRKINDPYKIWISEVMLQQTTVSAVIPYYLKWIKEFPTVESVAKAPLQRILRVWQGLGYYQRAKNIHAAAKIIFKSYNGKIPDNPQVLKELPGFGPYTVGAVLSIAFDQRYPIIDANIRRVAMRQLCLRGHADSSQDSKIINFLKRSLPKKNIGIFNQAAMELGALICRSREALCIFCPVRTACLAYKRGIQELIPTPKKTIIKNVNVAVAIIEKNGFYFIQKRPSRGLLADLWEFPGGKIKRGESATKALYREVKEELGVNILRRNHFMDTHHFYTQFRVKLHVWRCAVKPDPKIDKNHRWVRLQDIDKYPMPSGSVKIVERLQVLEST